MVQFAAEYSKPAALIMNQITETGEYPRQWVKEYQTAIVKKKPALDENSLRLISSTNFLSKIYESFLRDWLLPIISPFLDRNNYGGLKNSSTSHYLLNLLNFIHENLDEKNPQAVVLAQADLEKAFNSV